MLGTPSWGRDAGGGCEGGLESGRATEEPLLWLPLWKEERMAICIKSDSCAALGAFLKQRSPKPDINAVVRELALDLAEGRYRIDIQEHIEGKLNIVADALSRACQPGATGEIPNFLLQRPRSIPPRRDAAWWETRGDPGAAVVERVQHL